MHPTLNPFRPTCERWSRLAAAKGSRSTCTASWQPPVSTTRPAWQRHRASNAGVLAGFKTGLRRLRAGSLGWLQNRAQATADRRSWHASDPGRPAGRLGDGQAGVPDRQAGRQAGSKAGRQAAAHPAALHALLFKNAPELVAHHLPGVGGWGGVGGGDAGAARTVQRVCMVPCLVLIRAGCSLPAARRPTRGHGTTAALA